MTTRFPLGYNREHHARLRRLYGELVPSFDRILVRPGLYGIVDSLFSGLGRLPRRRALQVLRISTRNAGWLEIVMTGAAAGAGDVVLETEKAARRTCEYCGGSARLVVKVGLEVLLTRPDFELQDRLLCVDCASEFQNELGSK